MLQILCIASYQENTLLYVETESARGKFTGKFHKMYGVSKREKVDCHYKDVVFEIDIGYL